MKVTREQLKNSCYDTSKWDKYGEVSDLVDIINDASIPEIDRFWVARSVMPPEICSKIALELAQIAINRHAGEDIKGALQRHLDSIIAGSPRGDIAKLLKRTYGQSFEDHFACKMVAACSVRGNIFCTKSFMVSDALELIRKGILISVNETKEVANG